MTLRYSRSRSVLLSASTLASRRGNAPSLDWTLRAAFALLRRVGIRIEPFITMREGQAPAGLEQDASRLALVPLAPADIGELVRHMPNVDGTTLGKWFEDGRICFGVRAGSELIATMWCDLKKFNYPPNFRKLAAEEAYLFAAYIDPRYRGQDLAPLMRVACYAALRRIGRSIFCSYSEYLNRPARRFKSKVGAIEEELRVHIDLFGKWSKTLTLKKYV